MIDLKIFKELDCGCLISFIGNQIIPSINCMDEYVIVSDRQIPCLN